MTRPTTTSGVRRLSRLTALVATAGSLALVLAACGGSGGAGDSGSASSKNIDEAKSLVTAAAKPVTFTAPGPAFDVSSAQGKTVYYIGQHLSGQFSQSVAKGVNDAFESVGVKVIQVDDQGNIATTARLIQQGIALHPAAIIIAERSDLLQAPIKAAKAAGIPVITQFERDPGALPQSESALGIVAQVSFCYACAGRLIADEAIATSNGHVNSMTYWSSDDGVGTVETHAIRAELSRLCSGCRSSYKDLGISQQQTQIPTLTQSDLLNPKINYFLPVYDGMALYMLPAIHAANAQSRVKIVTFNADEAAMKEMKAKDVIVGDIGSPLQWFGYAVADETLRAMTGNETLNDEKVPLRLFDNNNMPDLSKDESTWYGADFKAGYASLWKQ